MRQEDYAARIQELEEALNACRTSKSMLLYLQRKDLVEEAKRLFESGAHVGETNAWRQTIIDSALRRQPGMQPSAVDKALGRPTPVPATDPWQPAKTEDARQDLRKGLASKDPQ